MAGIAMLVLALIAAVAVLFALRADDRDEDGENEEFVAYDREPMRQ